MYNVFRLLPAGLLAGVLFVLPGSAEGRGLPLSATSYVADDAPALRPTVLLTLPDIVLERGKTAELPVHISQAGEYFGFQLALQFDLRLIEIEAVEAGQTGSFGEFMHAARPDGRLAISWFDAVPHPLDGATPLFTVRVRVLANTTLREAVYVPSTGVRPEIYNAAKETSHLDIAFASGGNLSATGPALAVGLPQPNPTAQGTSLAVFLPTARTVVVELTDATGRLVHRFEQPLEAGAQQLAIPADAFPAPGVYAWRVVAGDETASGKVLRQ
jgi:hypothetical protein